MVGDFAVGKTSLTARFVKNIFSDKYLSTVGVKVDSKELSIDEETILKLMIWDIAGKDSFTDLDENYIKGSAGYLLIADGTRKNTLDVAFKLQEQMKLKLGDIPFCVLINKKDLSNEWECTDIDLEMIKDNHWTIFKTSAKSGENVDLAFQELATKLFA